MRGVGLSWGKAIAKGAQVAADLIWFFQTSRGVEYLGVWRSRKAILLKLEDGADEDGGDFSNNDTFYGLLQIEGLYEISLESPRNSVGRKKNR